MLRNILLLTCLTSICQAQTLPVRTLKTEPDSNIYSYVTFLTQGGTRIIDDYPRLNKTVSMFAYRVVITRSEFYKSVYFEKVIVNTKGVTDKIISRRKFDLQQFADRFETSRDFNSFGFISWSVDFGDFEFEYCKSRYIVRDMGNTVVLVTKKGAG